MYNLNSTQVMIAKSIKQIGKWATLRHMRNLGIDFYDAHVMVLGYPPRLV